MTAAHETLPADGLLVDAVQEGEGESREDIDVLAADVFELYEGFEDDIALTPNV